MVDRGYHPINCRFCGEKIYIPNILKEGEVKKCQFCNEVVASNEM